MNTNIIYKVCQHSIATLSLLPDSVTNEERNDVVDANFAMFRTDKAKVISLINPETNESLNSDHSIYDSSFIYTVNAIVKTKFDINIRGCGIHYFKTYEAGLNWYYQYYKKFNGKRITYYDRGGKEWEWNYKNGELNGFQQSWYRNREKSSEMNFKNGLRDGLQQNWYPNGQKSYECNYKNDKKDGLLRRWDKDGEKSFECNYKDGEKLSDK